MPAATTLAAAVRDLETLQQRAAELVREIELADVETVAAQEGASAAEAAAVLGRMTDAEAVRAVDHARLMVRNLDELRQRHAGITAALPKVQAAFFAAREAAATEGRRIAGKIVETLDDEVRALLVQVRQKAAQACLIAQAAGHFNEAYLDRFLSSLPRSLMDRQPDHSPMQIHVDMAICDQLTVNRRLVERAERDKAEEDRRVHRAALEAENKRHLTA